MIGSAKLVDPDLVRSYLLSAGYKFKRRGLEDTTYSVNENDLCVDEMDLYLDPQAMLDGIRAGKLYEDVE
jgi:hypothetical protein